jgi:hypothetical protein
MVTFTAMCSEMRESQTKLLETVSKEQSALHEQIGRTALYEDLKELYAKVIPPLDLL